MTLSRREVALAAFFARLQTLADSFPTIIRFGNWTLGQVGLPALVMEDGDDEVTTRLSSGVMIIETMVRVEVTIDPENDETIATDINEACADVMQAVASDRFLSGTVDSCLFMAAEGPFLADDRGSPTTASIRLYFQLRRKQSDRDPRAVV